MSGVLKECRMCRKLFSSSGKVCQECLKHLDEIYPIVRSFIRDSKNPKLEVTEIAEELEMPVMDVQGLVDCGYLGRDLPNAKMTDDDRGGKDRLAAELAKATNDLRAQAAARSSNKSVTYGQERYSQGKK